MTRPIDVWAQLSPVSMFLPLFGKSDHEGKGQETRRQSPCYYKLQGFSFCNSKFQEGAQFSCPALL